MAKVITGADGITHLRGHGGEALCGEVCQSSAATDGVLTCKACALIALQAIELSTKVERRLWRQL